MFWVYYVSIYFLFDYKFYYMHYANISPERDIDWTQGVV